MNLDPNPDPVCSQRSDPDPVRIGPDPQHWWTSPNVGWVRLSIWWRAWTGRRNTVDDLRWGNSHTVVRGAYVRMAQDVGYTSVMALTWIVWRMAAWCRLAGLSRGSASRLALEAMGKKTRTSTPVMS